MGAERQKSQPEPQADEQVDPNARRETSEANKAKARKWFQRAKELVDSRSYDYAIKCYIDGLSLWPDAVEEGHMPLRGCAAARQHTGGKKPNFRDTVKHSMNQKDPIKGMLNAEWLLAHDPMNVGYMEGLIKNASKARCEDTVMWIGHALSNAAEQEKKPSPKRFAQLKEVYEELGDRAQARGEPELAAEAFQRAIAAMNVQERLDPKDSTISNVRRDLSTKLTILKGQYQTAESFRDSVQDKEKQEVIRDEERMVQADDRLDRLIDEARREMEENPDVPGKVFHLVDLLTRRDDAKLENQAIGVLVEKFKETNEYRFKSRADDIRIRQLQRKYREFRAAGKEEEAKEARVEQLRYELKSYKERVAKYPTDNRLKYEYAARLFQARRFDEAIPLFQAARADAKNRSKCDLYLGRCFFEKDYQDQATATLSKALATQGMSDSDDAKALRYWLARSQEAKGQAQEALETFGHLLEMDYNYRDVRARMEKLRGQSAET